MTKTIQVFVTAMVKTSLTQLLAADLPDTEAVAVVVDHLPEAVVVVETMMIQTSSFRPNNSVRRGNHSNRSALTSRREGVAAVAAAEVVAAAAVAAVALTSVELST